MEYKLSEDFFQNPYPYLTKKREHSPIHMLEEHEGQKIWLLTKYEDVDYILTNSKKYSSDSRKFMSPEEKALFFISKEIDLLYGKNMLEVDPPDHGRLRKLVHKAFTPKIIKQMDSRIKEVSLRLIREIKDKKEFDLINDYAFPLPIIVISEILGIPYEDHQKFRVWSNTLIKFDSILHHQDTPIFQEIQITAKEFTDYLSELFAKRRSNPREDLISKLVKVEEEGDSLSESELFSMVVLLIVAGHETTVNLIGNGLLTLLKNPEKIEELRHNPQLLDAAVEELLRYESPVSMDSRFVVENHIYKGFHFGEGDLLLLSLGSANRDPDVFKNPDQVNFHRESNKHLAFGKGIHYCLGAPLARMEGKTALEHFIEELPAIRLKEPQQEIDWRETLLFRGMKSLPLVSKNP